MTSATSFNLKVLDIVSSELFRLSLPHPSGIHFSNTSLKTKLLGKSALISGVFFLVTSNRIAPFLRKVSGNASIYPLFFAKN
jgi:hypothetical protein